MATHKAARVEGAARAAHGGPQGRREDANPEDDGFGSSINSLFLLSGPRGGVIDPRSRERQLRALADVVDDAVLDVLRDAWDGVAVPADRYWRCPQTLHRAAAGALATLSQPMPVAATAAPAAPPRVPDPRRLQASFYSNRVEALAARGYAPNRGLVPLALDRTSGLGSKAFNVLPMWSGRAFATDTGADGAVPRVCRDSAVADFVAAVRHPPARNLYVLVDEDAPVDPYFDIDFACDSNGDGRDADATDALASLQQCSGGGGAAAAVLSVALVEELLLKLLTALRREVEAAFHAAVEECVVLTSSFQLARRGSSDAAPPVARLETLTISFHVHFRLAGGAALESVRELHAFMAALRTRLQATAADTSGDVALEEAQLASLVLRCVDFGVYSRWRAFRLPWNVKAAGTAEGCGGGPAIGAGADLLAEQAAQLDMVVPSVSVGDAAPSVLQSLVLSSDAETSKAQRYLIQRLRQYFRFLLPVLPGATPLTSAALHDFLLALTPPQVRTAAFQLRAALPANSDAPAVVRAWVMELACIVRDSTPQSASGRPLRLLRDEAAAAATAAAAAAQAAASASGNPFEVPMPPRPRSVRVRVDDAAVKRLLAEVFWCIAPEYGRPDAGARTVSAAAAWESVAASSAVMAERITAHYEDAIRAYYVTQKQSKYCLRLHRCHRSTFAQLYLTFGSIKLRCYANDCCERCCVIPWEAPEGAAPVPTRHPGYPKYERLAALHAALFPPLSAEELVRRYGTKALVQLS